MMEDNFHPLYRDTERSVALQFIIYNFYNIAVFKIALSKEVCKHKFTLDQYIPCCTDLY